MAKTTALALLLAALLCARPTLAGTVAFGVMDASSAAGGSCGAKCCCCANSASTEKCDGFILLQCNEGTLPDCAAEGGIAEEVPMLALSIIPQGQPMLVHTSQQVSRTCCAGGTGQKIETSCKASTTVEASLHRSIAWDTASKGLDATGSEMSTVGKKLVVSVDTEIEGHTMDGWTQSAKPHSVMTSGKTEMFQVQSPVNHPCEYTVSNSYYGTVQSTSRILSYTQGAELRYRRAIETGSIPVTLTFSTQNTDNTCSFRESVTPCAHSPALEENVWWGPVSQACMVSGSKVKRKMATLKENGDAMAVQSKNWNYEWDCKGRSVQQFDRRSHFNGLSFVWNPSVKFARSGRTDKALVGLGTQCPINVETSKVFNNSNIDWFRFGFEMGSRQFRVVENGRYVCRAHADGVLVYPNQCNSDYDPNQRYSKGRYDHLGCGYCMGGGKRTIDVCQNRQFGSFVTQDTCEAKCDQWSNCQGYAFGCESAGRCDCFLYPKRGVGSCPKDDIADETFDFVLKKAPKPDEIRQTEFCWMMENWEVEGKCFRKSRGGEWYPLKAGDRFSITINDRDHVEYKQNDYLLYKSKFTTGYYLSRGTDATPAPSAEETKARSLVEAAKAAKAAKAVKAAYDAPDTAMCSSGDDSADPKFFAVFSLLQGNDGELHSSRINSAYFTRKNVLHSIDLKLKAKAEVARSEDTPASSTLLVASCLTVAAAFFATGLVVVIRRSRSKAALAPTDNAAVLASSSTVGL